MIIFLMDYNILMYRSEPFLHQYVAVFVFIPCIHQYTNIFNCVVFLFYNLHFRTSIFFKGCI